MTYQKQRNPLQESILRRDTFISEVIKIRTRKTTEIIRILTIELDLTLEPF